MKNAEFPKDSLIVKHSFWWRLILFKDILLKLLSNEFFRMVGVR